MKLATITLQALLCCYFIGISFSVQAQSIEVKLPQDGSGLPVLDYGKVQEGIEGSDMITQKITLSNIGDATVTLTSIESDCACLTAYLPENPSVDPGSELVIEIAYNNRRLGPFSKLLTLHTDASGQGSIQMMVKGEVQLRSE